MVDCRSGLRSQTDSNTQDPTHTKGKPTSVRLRTLQSSAMKRSFARSPALSGTKTKAGPRSGSIVRQANVSYAMPAIWRTGDGKRVAHNPSPKARHRFTRLISLPMSSTSSDTFDTSWNMNYARVHRPWDKVHIRDALESGFNPLVDTTPVLAVDVFEWIEAVQSQLSAQETLDLASISQQHRVSRRVFWANTVLWLLRYEEVPPVDFLKATCGDRELPASWVLDTLTLTAIWCNDLGEQRRKRYITTLTDAFVAFAGRGNSDHILLEGPMVRHLLHSCDNEQVPSIYHALKTGNFRADQYTYLQAATRLAQSDHFDQGLDALLEAHHVRNTWSPRIRSVCVMLLRRAMKQPGGLRVCLRLVDNLVKFGLRLNTRLCNTLILNAVEAGDLKTAHVIYESLIQNNIRADEYTYALLLKGCKQDPEDNETLSRVIRNALADRNVVINSIIGTEILHCLVLHHGTQWTKNKVATEGEAATWPTICQAYCQLFDTTPLAQLGIPLPSPLQSRPPSREPMPAPIQAVGIMLSTYLQLHSKLFAPVETAYAIYESYRALVAAGTAPFVDLARSDHTANAFLMVFTLSKPTLIHAAEVVKDMQRAAAASPPSGAGPSVQTWSIFLRGFTQHRQLRLAEQVLSYMRSNNIKPNQVTWITLAKGYALAQDVDGMVDAMSRAEAEDMAWDDWGRGGFRRLRDQRGFMSKWELERGTSATKIDFTEDLRAGLSERLARAGSDKDVMMT